MSYFARKCVDWRSYQDAKQEWERLLTDPLADYDELDRLESILNQYEANKKIQKKNKY